MSDFQYLVNKYLGLIWTSLFILSVAVHISHFTSCTSQISNSYYFLAFALNWNDLIVLEADIEHKEGNQETKIDPCADFFYQKTSVSTNLQKSFLFLLVSVLSWSYMLIEKRIYQCIRRFYCQDMSRIKVLSVAEKNDAAKNIAAHLSRGNAARVRWSSTTLLSGLRKVVIDDMACQLPSS